MMIFTTNNNNNNCQWLKFIKASHKQGKDRKQTKQKVLWKTSLGKGADLLVKYTAVRPVGHLLGLTPDKLTNFLANFNEPYVWGQVQEL